MRPPSTANPQSIAASTPAGMRIYAVGDIHGRADLLLETIARIDEDLERRPVGHAFEVYLGDYIDRGPDSKTVIDLLSVRLVKNRAVCPARQSRSLDGGLPPGSGGP
jgi:serine/threonine protein phosphatase 1